MKALREFLIGIIVEALVRKDALDAANKDAEIPYNRRRYHGIKLAIELILPVILIGVVGIAYVASASNIIAMLTLIGMLVVTIYWLLSVAKQARTHPNGKRGTYLAWGWTAGTVAVIAAIVYLYSLFVQNFEVKQITSIGAIVVATGVMWYVGRQVYCWTHHTIVRSGDVMINQRPGSIFWLVSEIKSSVNVGKVVCNVGQNSFQKILGFYSVDIDGAAAKDAKYWHNMHLVLDGPQLFASVTQRR